MFRLVVAAALLLAVTAWIIGQSLGGWGREDFGPENPILTRDDAMEHASYAHEVAVRQGVDLNRATCLYEVFFGPRDPRNSTWVIAVDWEDGRNLFEVVARTCPAYESGDVRHAVVMARNGDIIEAR